MIAAVTAVALTLTLRVVVLTLRRLMVRIECLEVGRLADESAAAAARAAQWDKARENRVARERLKTSTPHRSCGCACHGGRP